MYLIEDPTAILVIKIFQKGEEQRYSFKAAAHGKSIRPDMSLDQTFLAWMALGQWIQTQNELGKQQKKDSYYRLREENREIIDSFYKSLKI